MKEKPINKCPVPRGIIMVIGGHEDKGDTPDREITRQNNHPLDVLKSFRFLIKSNNPVLEIVTTASSEGDELFKEYVKGFNDVGIKNINRIHHEDRQTAINEGPTFIERINKADAVFFSGGDQLKLTYLYGGTEFLLHLKQRYIHHGLLIGGTSAGAMAMSTPMIYAGNKDVQQFSGEIRITTGLEFLKDVCIDTHFVDRGRFIRMAQVIVTNPTCIGIGIEEDTAMVIRNGIEGEVIGSGVVIIIQGHNIQNSNITEFGNKKKISIRGLDVDILSHGDSFIIPQTNPPHI